MAGTVAVSETTHTSLKRVKFVWISDAAGAADATTTEYYDGQIIMFATVPGTGGTQPTNAYDVVLKNADGVDMLAGAGADRSNVNTEFLTANIGGFAAEKMVLGITNAGNAKAGTIYAWVR
jgi:hypothetical protein